MTKKNLLTLTLLVLLTSCASTFGIVGLGNKMKKVEIGMTKSEVFNIIGTSYDVIAASQTPEGNLEILTFLGINSGHYSVYFLDGKLVEWHIGTPSRNKVERIIIEKKIE